MIFFATDQILNEKNGKNNQIPIYMLISVKLYIAILMLIFQLKTTNDAASVYFFISLFHYGYYPAAVVLGGDGDFYRLIG